MDKLQQIRKKSLATLIAISIIGVSVYLGFTPLFEKIEGGVAGAVVGASFGAIFVIVLTMYLLNKQTEIEQESKRGEKIFEEKMKIYWKIFDETEHMLEDGKITKNIEMKKLPFVMISLIAIGSGEVIKSYQEIFDQINEIFAEKPKKDVVELNSDQIGSLMQSLAKFANACRVDLGVSNYKVSDKLFSEASQSVTETSSMFGRNKPLPEKDKVDQARASCGGSDYTIKRYQDTSIRIIKDGEENPVNNTRAIMREINEEYDLGFIGHTWKGQKVNTRSQGKRMIDLLNSRKKND